MSTDGCEDEKMVHRRHQYWSKYFCDRKEETRHLLQLLENGNNVSLIAPRRIGKTGLIENLFHLQQVKKDYYTFLIDIYATKNIEEMIAAMGSSMFSSLRLLGTKVMQKFTGILNFTLWHIIDAMGNPSWNLWLVRK